MDWIIWIVNILVVSILFGFIIFYRIDQREKWVFFFALMVKILSGILISFIYLHYFNGGDSWLYFKEAEKLSFLVSDNQIRSIDIFLNNQDWQNIKSSLSFSNEPRALFFTKIVYLLFLITAGNFWILLC